MLKRLSSLVLILVLGGSALAGVPMHQNEPGCNGMAGMEMMDCCKMAQMQGNAPATIAARLCCMIDCQEPGPTGAQFNLRAPDFSVSPLPPAVMQSPGVLPIPLERPFSTPIYLPNLQASYIRNLSLLI